MTVVCIIERFCPHEKQAKWDIIYFQLFLKDNDYTQWGKMVSKRTDMSSITAFLVQKSSAEDTCF